MLAFMFIIPVSTMTGSATENSFYIQASSSVAVAEPGDDIIFSAKARYGDILEGTEDVTDETEFTWDFGDGETETGKKVHHAYASTGDYTVTVSGTYADKTSETTLTVKITNLPHAKIRVNTNRPRAYLDRVEFDASESYDRNGRIVSYEWDFGDGDTDTGSTVSHTFDEGTYDVVLKVTDNDGYTDMKKITIYSNLPKHRVSNTEGNSTNPVIYEDSGVLRVFWIEDGSSVMSSSSDDDGWTWSEPENIFDDATSEITKLDLAYDGKYLALAIECSPPGEFPFLYVIYSSDYGGTWTDPYSVRGDMASVDVVGENVYLAYRSWSHLGQPDFVLSIVITWTVDGHAVSRGLPNPNGGEFSAIPRISAIHGEDSNEIYVAVADYVTRNVYFWESPDNGNTWSSPEIITQLDTVGEDYFDLEATEHGVYFIWSNRTFGNHELWFNVYRKGSWGENILLTNALGNSFQPEIMADKDGYIHMMWSDFRNCSYDIFETTLDPNGNTIKSDSKITESAGDSFHPHMAIDSENRAAFTNEYFRFEVWENTSDGEIYFKNNIVDGYIGQTENSIKETVKRAKEYIESLPDDYFSNPYEKNALLREYDTVERLIDMGFYGMAASMVKYDISRKMDGSQGGSSKDDWVIADTAQAYLGSINEILVASGDGDISIWGVSTSTTTDSIHISWHVGWIQKGSHWSTKITLGSFSHTFSYSESQDTTDDTVPKYFEYTFKDLSPNTDYSYTISAEELVEGSGNKHAAYGPYSIRTDSEILKITNGPDIDSLTTTAATILWETNLESSSVIYYGTDPSQKDISVLGDSGLYHSVHITGLQSGTTYYYTIHSKYSENNPTSEDGVATRSESESTEIAEKEGEFTTPSTNNYISAGPEVSYKSYTRVTISWETTRKSNSIVFYRYLGSWKSVKLSDRVNEHSVTIDGLLASTTYEYYVRSTCSDGATSRSDIHTFRTKGLISGIKKSDYYSIKNNKIIEGEKILWTTSEKCTTNEVLFTQVADETSATGWASSKYIILEDNGISHQILIRKNNPDKPLVKGEKYAYKVRSVTDNTGEDVISSVDSFTALPDEDDDGLHDALEDYGWTVKRDLNGDGDFDDNNEVIKAAAGKMDSNHIWSYRNKEHSDSDDLKDYQEWKRGTNPRDSDTDRDGLNDKEEINTYKTDPRKVDMDGDGMWDKYEVVCGTPNGGWQEPRVYNERYAVLISGGGNPSSNHARYWNDLCFMYDVLKKNGYKDDKIFVLYADGNPPSSINCPNPQDAVSHTNIIDYPATKAQVQSVFSQLKNKISNNDFLFVYVTDHGNGYNSASHELWNSKLVEYGGDEGNEIHESDINWNYHKTFGNNFLHVWKSVGEDLDGDEKNDNYMYVSHWSTDGDFSSPHTSDNDAEIEVVFDFSSDPKGLDGSIDWCYDDGNIFTNNVIQPPGPYDLDVDGIKDDMFCDVDGDNHLDVDLNYDVGHPNNWEINGEDENDDGEFYGSTDYLDLNENGINDWIGIDESIILWKESIKDDDFSSYLNNIYYKRSVFVMGECQSGGFINDLSNSKRIIITASKGDEYSWRADTEGEYEEFLYHFVSALNKKTPNGILIDSDSDGNGYISIDEAFIYAYKIDTQKGNHIINGESVGGETPQENDPSNLVGNTYL